MKSNNNYVIMVTISGMNSTHCMLSDQIIYF